ncbi:LPS assembly lipoprotein LptE [Sulfurivermis fontis]|uniref:LPS-assembly lipoprotein LptE n=1 Tax=Sulfurivermis fontis TaxID=1972068 RepID=UPI0015586368|nr:LPS assembly lipoprotein LptE [Sulfurivermis fontis]
MLLTSCGFHLRGAVELPPQLARTQLVGVDARSELADEITAALEGAGAQVVTADATAQLHVSGERENRRLLSVGRTGRASEYEVTYQFSFELRAPVVSQDRDGQAKVHYRVLVPRQSVSLSRDYSFDRNNVLGKGEEEDLLIREMRAFAVRQMLLRLRAGLQMKDSEQ